MDPDLAGGGGGRAGARRRLRSRPPTGSAGRDLLEREDGNGSDDGARVRRPPSPARR